MNPIGKTSDPVSLLIAAAGPHKFSYTKVEQTTGEAIWRWPREPSLSQRVAPKGALLDLRV